MGYNLNSNIVIQEDNNEFLLLNMENGMFYGLDEVGSIIFKFLLDECSYSNILNNIQNIYGISSERASRDVEIFMTMMSEFGLIENV